MEGARKFLSEYFLEWYPKAPSVVAVRIMLVFTLALVGLAFLSRVSYVGQPEGSPNRALVAHLEARGIVADEGSLHWISPPEPGIFSDLGTHRVLLLAGTKQDPLRDFYLAKVRLTPDGRVAQARLWNLSKTPFCGERGLWARGSVAAVAGTVVEGFSNVAFYDFRGEGRELTRSLSTLDKLKNAVTNYQKTGHARGTGLAFLEFGKPQDHLEIEMSDSTLVVRFDEGDLKVHVTPEGFGVDGVGGSDAFEFHPAEKAVSGHVAWIVDTARATDLIGKDKIGWAEAKFYRIADFFKRGFYGLAGGQYTVNSIREEMGDVAEDGKMLKQFFAEIKGSAVPDLTPPPVTPLVTSDVMEGEGLWQPVLDTVFNLRDKQAPPSLYRTFFRPDPERPFAHANLVAWDPRLVELHVSAGAVEPKSETGRAGTGMIPRDAETLARLLAGFNGGFQALHGEFGLMQEGKVYLPPKPWAATVAVLKGGRIGFGTWPGPEAGKIPPEIYSYRQNLTPLIMDSKINPYKRRWWGSSPDLNPDSPSIARSGICWTESNHIVYALAYSVNETTFANMMKQSGCHYLIQLDVNAGHSGFEFIRVTPEGKTPPLPKPLDGKWEAEGSVSGMEGFLFRSKKLFKNMALMRFPRYIGKEPRDFFYITLKRNLPGDPVAPGKGEAGEWAVAGLPGNAFPPSFALATLHPQERTAVKLVRMDPRWTQLEVQGVENDKPERDGALLALPSSLKVSVYGMPGWSVAEGERVILFGFDALAQEWNVEVKPWSEADGERWSRIIAVSIPPESDAPAAGAIGIGPHRFFTWAESSDGDMAALTDALERAGATEVIKIPAAAGESVGWSFVRTGEGEAKIMPIFERQVPAPGQFLIAFAPTAKESVVRLFPDTEVVLPKVWNPPQVKRIRYFKPEPEPEDEEEGAGDAEHGE